MSGVKLLSPNKNEKNCECIGHVVRILNKYSLVVNISDFLKEGDIVQIFDIGEELLDLNGESLGEYIYIKATLTVAQVESRYCICETLSKEKVKPILLTPFTAMTQTVKFQAPLPIHSKDIKEVSSIDMNVLIGDKVRKLQS